MYKKILLFALSFTLVNIHAQDLNSRWLEKINEGKRAYADERYRSAFQYFQEASKMIPTDTTAFVYLVDCAYKTNNPSVVYESVEKLWFLDYDKPGIYETLSATARELEKDFPKALGFVEQGQKKYPNNQVLQFEEINVFYEYGDYESAISKLNEFIRQYPDTKKAYNLLIHIHKEIKQDLAQALEAIRMAQKAFPRDIDFQKEESDIYLRAKDFTNAQAKLESLIQQNPNDPTLYYNLALIFFDKGDFETSAEICKKAIELKPDYLEAIFNVGTFYYNYGLTYTEALSDMTLYQYKSQGEEFQRNAKEFLELAKPYFERAIELNTEELDAYENLNTINALLANLDAMMQQTETVIGASQVISSNTDKKPKLLIHNLRFEYTDVDNSLNKGETGFVRFTLENLGNADATNLEVVLMQPVVMPGIDFNPSFQIDSLAVNASKEIEISVNYLANDAKTRGIEKLEGAGKMRLFVKEPNGYNADLVEFMINIGGDMEFVADASVNISDTEDIDFSPYPSSRNFLFIIGIDKYKQWPALNNAVNDAKSVKEALLKNYRFEPNYVYELYNENANHENIRNELIKIKRELTENDNLVIYYAGHGYYDAEFDEGSWIPVDARNGEETDYIPNSTLVKYLRGLESKHTFLIADACFSGSLFVNDNELSYQPNNDKVPSRWGLTSGNLEYVADGEAGKNSPFAKYLIECLVENNSETMSATDVIGYVKFKVKNEYNQTPIGKPLNMPDNKGGEFVFYKR